MDIILLQTSYVETLGRHTGQDSYWLPYIIILTLSYTDNHCLNHCEAGFVHHYEIPDFLGLQELFTITWISLKNKIFLERHWKIFEFYICCCQSIQKRFPWLDQRLLKDSFHLAVKTW